MLPERAPNYRSAGPQAGWCTIRKLDGRTFVYATAGINLVRKLQTQLVAELRSKDFVDTTEGAIPPVSVTGKFDPATAKALLAAVAERSPVWAPNVRAEANAQTIGPSIMLATLWIAYMPAWTFEQAYARITPWGNSLYVHLYTPLPWNTDLPETEALSRDVIYSWREDEAPKPLITNTRDAQRAREDARAAEQVLNPRDGTVPYIITGALAMGLLTFVLASEANSR